MKKLSIISILVLCGLFAYAQDDCNADAGIAILPHDCIENFSTSLPITEFEVAPSGTTTYEFVFTAPAVNDTIERVIGVNDTGEFDFSLDTVTMQPFTPGEYGVTIFAFDSEDLYELTTNPALVIFDCIEGNGEESLAEILTCIQSLGLIMNTLTIDLVIADVLESYAPILLMRPMCYDFSEKQTITVVDGATDSCNPIGIDALIDRPNYFFDQHNRTLRLMDDPSSLRSVHLYSTNGRRVHQAAANAEIAFPALSAGVYVLEFRSDLGKVAEQIVVY